VQRTALELAQQAGAFLGERGIENGRLEAELLLSGVLGLRRLDLYLQFDRPVAAGEIERFRAAVRRRLRHEPVQYILGEVAFRRLKLKVDRRVLIPRPETEVLVESVLEETAGGAGLVAVEIGTGSGAIAISLAVEGVFDGLVATDVSPEALQVASENAALCGVAERIEFRHGDAWAALEPGARYDVVVSNPPYIAETERAGLAPEVRDWEPDRALFGGPDGLDVVTALIQGATSRLEPGGLLALEIGAGQGQDVLERIRASGYIDGRLVRDLAGRERVVLARTPGTVRQSKD